MTESGEGKGAYSVVTRRDPGPGPLLRGMRVAVRLHGRVCGRGTHGLASVVSYTCGGWGDSTSAPSLPKQEPRHHRSLKAETSGSSPLTC